MDFELCFLDQHVVKKLFRVVYLPILFCVVQLVIFGDAILVKALTSGSDKRVCCVLVVGKHLFEKLVDMMNLNRVLALILSVQNQAIRELIKDGILLLKKSNDLFLL